MRACLTALLLAVGVAALTAFCAVWHDTHIIRVRHERVDRDDDDYVTEVWKVGLWFSPWYEAHRNDSLPRRGPRKRVPTEPTHHGATAIQDKAVPISAAKR